MIVGIVLVAVVIVWCVATVAWDKYHNPGEGVADYDPYTQRRDEWSNN